MFKNKQTQILRHSYKNKLNDQNFILELLVF